MTRGWGKSLLFSVFTAIFFFSFLFIIADTSIECASAAEPQVVVNPTEVNVLFNSPKGSREFYPAEKHVTITNYGGSATNVSISPSSVSSGIDINPKLSTPVSLAQGESISLEIKARHTLGSGDGYFFTIKADGESSPVKINVIYCAKIQIDPPSKIIDFGEVRYGTTKTLEDNITIKELYGYKTVTVKLELTGKNKEWVSSSPSGNIDVSSNPQPIDFTLKAPKKPDQNQYSWTFSASTSDAGTETVTIKAYILKPPKLGKLPRDKKLELKFDKPKGTVSEYEREIAIKVRNEGDEVMYLKTVKLYETLGNGIKVKIDAPRKVSMKGTENIDVQITVPYATPEGTYSGRLYVEATDEKRKYDAGKGYVDIILVIKWPVDFTVSSNSSYYTSSSPPSIDFGSLELKERGYENKRLNLTLTEYYLYKPVRNLRFSTNGEYGNWLKEEMAFFEIPPGESRNITLKIEPGLEAVPKDYSWEYYISGYDIGAKQIDITARIVPMNISEMLEYLRTFRECPLYVKYPSSEAIISNGEGMLEVVDQNGIDAEDWKKIPILMKGTLSLLSSLNDSIVSSEAEDYDKAVNELLVASISASTIGSYSELKNGDLLQYAQGISAGADKTTEEVLIDEARMLELRAYDTKKAVEHAIAKDDISGLKEGENVLESTILYHYAATLYEVLGDKRKRIECMNEKYGMIDWYYELVSDATDLRFEAGKSILDSKENDLVRIRTGDTFVLSNPYKYDSFSANYGSAESGLEDALKKYKVAGIKENEPLIVDTSVELNNLRREKRQTLFLFFFVCILYGAVFIYVITRIIMGTMAYMRDTNEREIGNVVVRF